MDPVQTDDSAGERSPFGDAPPRHEASTRPTGGDGPTWVSTDDPDEWAATSPDGSREARVRAVDAGFEVRFLGRRTGADAGSAGAVPRVPMLLASAEDAFEFCNERLRR